MADTDVFFKTRQIGDFQQQLLDREIKQQLANAELYKMASGQGLPAAIQIANAIQGARDAGNVQRMRDLYDAGKLLQPGIYPGMGEGIAPEVLMGGAMGIPAPQAAPRQAAPKINMGTAEQVAQELGTLPPLTAYDPVLADVPAPPAMTPPPVDMLAGTLAQREAAKEAAKESAKLQAQTALKPTLEQMTERAVGQEKLDVQFLDSFNKNVANANNQLSVINQALNHPGLDANFGLAGAVPNRPGSEAADFAPFLEQIRGNQFLEAFQNLRGGGAITEIEGIKAEQAIARMQTTQSADSFRKALKEYRDIVSTGLQRQLNKRESIAGRRGEVFTPSPAQPAPQGGTGIDDKLRQAGYSDAQIQAYKQARGLQ